MLRLEQFTFIESSEISPTTLAECGNRAKVRRHYRQKETGCARKEASFLSRATRKVPFEDHPAVTKSFRGKPMAIRQKSRETDC
jgi:hypothetical protein